MKARLDHIGIAVANLDEALAFYRDALGLEVEPPEDVASQGVRAHFMPTGDSAIELLEATAAGSPIAKYVAKRGPGLHHITLGVEDIHAALAQLKARGVRLIDETPRVGAHGALVAFIHPSSAHGVLVELKGKDEQEGTEPSRPSVLPVGELELTPLLDGYFRLDGGAMFGVVPKTLWQKRTPADDRNRITMAMRPLLVRGERLMIVDAGCGDKMDARNADIYGFDRRDNLDVTMAQAGVRAEDIEIVLASHLHFDHAGGFTVRNATGAIVPRFPNARYLVNRGEWDDATHPHERNRASYFAENYVPLQEAGVLELMPDNAQVAPGIRVQRTGGHTRFHQIVFFESAGRTAVFAADLLPTTAHVDVPWIMGYDLYPMETLEFKRAFVREAIEREYIILFEHDPLVPAGYIREKKGRPVVEPL